MASIGPRHQLSLEAVLNFSETDPLTDGPFPAAEQGRAESTFRHVLSHYQNPQSIAHGTSKRKRGYNHGEVLRLMYDHAIGPGKGKVLRYILAAMTSFACGGSEAQYEITFERIVDELFDFEKWEEARKHESIQWICDIADILVDGFLPPCKSHVHH